MIRSNSITKYELEVRNGYKELFDVAIKKMQHSGDLLLCQQNGFIFFNGNPCIGLGDEGLNSMQALNSISIRGIENITEDKDYFGKLNIFFKGASEFEYSIQNEKNTYLKIWENSYFLRILTQIVNLSNGIEYDWCLDISKLTSSGKNKHIRENIIKRLDKTPTFKKIISIAYNRNIRNAIAHSQYNCVQGGIMYHNYKSDKYANLQGVTFEEWEKKYIMTFFLLRGAFEFLKQIKDEKYLPISKMDPSKGIQIKVPCKESKWRLTYIYPNESGDTWRFVKTS